MLQNMCCVETCIKGVPLCLSYAFLVHRKGHVKRFCLFVIIIFNKKKELDM